MQNTVESPLPLDTVITSMLPGGGTDIWLRKNISQEDQTDENGITQTVYTADEVYLRSAETIDADEAMARFNELWALGAGYDPQSRTLTADQQWKADVENALVELAGLITGGE